MSRQRCNLLVAGVFAVGLVDSLILTCFTFRLSFCHSNIINHFYCDFLPLLTLSCSDIRTAQIALLASMCYIVAISLVTILLSYICIISTILQIRSAEGRYKAFSTCASHFCAVGMFHGTQLSLCFLPISSSSIAVDMECFLLAVMAYDRYVAICNPLLYSVIMSRQRCNQLVAGVFAVGLVDSLILTCFTFRLSFCDSNIINYFSCDSLPLLALSCSDTHTTEIVILASMCYTVVISLVTILLSYVCIISTILRIRSAEGRYKVFSTCASHLCAVGMFHGTQVYLCFLPISSSSVDMGKTASVFYTVAIPMLNPLVYSLRNREVKDALRKAKNKLVTKS
nr:olfactory receptor 1020-like [Pelodiscus sinensis]|eukprot:XP_006122806.2 olfactory receptor 1020-like [Pelodiscus sinensis]